MIDSITSILCGTPLQGNLTVLQRILAVALMTAEVHNRDVLRVLVNQHVNDPQNFLWQAQFRCVHWVSLFSDSCSLGLTQTRLKLSVHRLQLSHLSHVSIHLRGS